MSVPCLKCLKMNSRKGIFGVSGTLFLKTSLRLINRNLFLELRDCKDILDEQKRENQIRYIQQNNG